MGLLLAGAFRPYDYGIAYGGCVVASIAGASALGLMTRNRWSQAALGILGWTMFWLLVIAQHASSDGHPDHRLDWIPWLHVAACITVFATISILDARSG
jgi:hypothetical protein